MENNKNLNLDTNCLFCKIINKTIAAKIISENQYVLAFLDIDPVSDGHTLIIPKFHCNGLVDCDNNYLKQTFLMVKNVSNLILNSPLKPKGINYLSNFNQVAGQMVFHFHVHIMPKYEKNSGFSFNTINKKVNKIENIYQILNKK